MVSEDFLGIWLGLVVTWSNQRLPPLSYDQIKLDFLTEVIS